MNRKGYTLIELIAVIAILAIVMVIGVYSVTSYMNRSKQKSFDVLINSIEDAAAASFTDCLANSDASLLCQHYSALDRGGAGHQISIKELIEYGYLEPMKNPWNTSEKCDGENSFVVVFRRNTDSLSLTYETCLICGTHQTQVCHPLPKN